MQLNSALEGARRAKSYGYIAIQGIYRVRSVLPGVLCGVLFSYEERLETNWYKIFETAATLLEPGSILVIPTIGTNNRMDFFHSAICIWIAMRACLQNEDSALHRLAEIRVLTPWAAEANQSSRTIQHLFNLMRLHGKEAYCQVCCVAKVEILLPCGHRILCEQCADRVRLESHSLCPFCRKPFDVTTMWRAAKLEDCSDMQCCEVNGPREIKVAVPCGCFKMCCLSCTPHPGRMSQCPACKKNTDDYIPYFDV
jgi:hypothetical protein